MGPPQSPPSNPYTNLFNSGLYQQYLGQLLANTNGSNINPMLLQAQLAMASYNNHANLISERLKQNRFSPYSSPPVSSLANNIGSAGLASAFKALGSGKVAVENSSPPVSPPHSTSPPPNMRLSPGSVKSEITPSPPPSAPLRSDIKSIENMINGLNGSSEGRFSLSHSASQPQLS